MDMGTAIKTRATFQAEEFDPMVQQLLESGKVREKLIKDLREALRIAGSKGQASEQGVLMLGQVLAVITLEMAGNKRARGRPAGTTKEAMKARKENK